jgi:hypothetical protein
MLRVPAGMGRICARRRFPQDRARMPADVISEDANKSSFWIVLTTAGPLHILTVYLNALISRLKRDNEGSPPPHPTPLPRKTDMRRRPLVS